ncbi:hypothetical protein GGI11_007638 [Coemansia sp. RSA 2049]|nr:hypothetical protein GGI11_007638 [Coemansia sp. RSA 2049]
MLSYSLFAVGGHLRPAAGIVPMLRVFYRVPGTRSMSSGGPGSAGHGRSHHGGEPCHEVDPRVGSVAAHRFHLVVCNSSSEEWPSRVDAMSPAISALAHGGARLPGRAMVTLSDFSPFKDTTEKSSSSTGIGGRGEGETAASKYERIDVAVFPLGLVAKQLDSDGVAALLRWLGHEVLPTSWSSTHTNLPQPPSSAFEHSWLELTNSRHIFVCTHGTRDRLCGIHGGKLLADLRALITSQGLADRVAAWATSHIGGHKYAANAIVYPRGDWYGTWCARCGSGSSSGSDSDSSVGPADAQAIIDAATRDIVWWDAWRGATNMSKMDQINAWRFHNDSADHVGGHGVTGSHPSADSADPFTHWIPKSSRRKSSVIGS